MNNTPSKTVRDFFTSEEWDAIDSALCDFQDYSRKLLKKLKKKEKMMKKNEY